jgi:hypothetical protein
MRLHGLAKCVARILGLVLSAVALIAVPRPSFATPGITIWRDTFTGPTGVVTSERAYWDSTNPYRQRTWEMTSGCLFRTKGHATTSPHIDSGSPDVKCSKHTDNADFRLNTVNRSYGNVNVRLKLNVVRQTSTPKTPPVAWDGVHIFLRYQSQFELYYASTSRRDGRVAIKKKCRGGPSNGGTYYTLAQRRGYPIRIGKIEVVGATVRTNADGSVTILLLRSVNGSLTPVLRATDRGVGCAPLRRPGAVGLRGDNTEFRFDDFTVSANK